MTATGTKPKNGNYMRESHFSLDLAIEFVKLESQQHGDFAMAHKAPGKSHSYQPTKAELAVCRALAE